jgi:hypothetical protein
LPDQDGFQASSSRPKKVARRFLSKGEEALVRAAKWRPGASDLPTRDQERATIVRVRLRHHPEKAPVWIESRPAAETWSEHVLDGLGATNLDEPREIGVDDLALC